jgi:hypothetical protein
METNADILKKLQGKSDETFVLPKGKYKAVVADCGLMTNDHGVRVNYVFELTGNNEFDGRKVWKSYPTDWAETVLEDLMKLEIIGSGKPLPKDDMSDLEDFVDKANNKMVEIFVSPKEKDGKTYTNVFINGIATVADTKDEIPF